MGVFEAAEEIRRERRIAELEGEMNVLGRFIVFTVDRDDVHERLDERELTDEEADAIAATAALDLSSNEMDKVPLGEAIDFAATENAAGDHTPEQRREAELHALYEDQIARDGR